MTEVLVGIAGLIRIGIGILVRKAIATSQVHSAEARAQKVVLDAQVEAKTVMKQSLVDGNEQIAALRREAEEDIRARRGDPAPGAPRSRTRRRAWTTSSPTSSSARRRWTIVTGRCSTCARSSNGRRRATSSGSRPWPE